ncbi:alanine--tRNA ligase-related protein [Candidatus Carsonella ruddii]|uniref:Alanine--tRNA ligase n=1 Tax=Candidatus Carsonella ruddii (Diaphorina cf. continua) TaxID=2661587 RepID=A0A7R6VZC1_CARRU|nr:alanine--tRNA ligase-related protein [Candidatus Carsonella ruddii (Diaphorina cf. continua)]BCG49346.1 alanine--tRNA ligase [Candidatus Carsonella ruddii (Diaphorina cf. continua)]
MINFLKYYNFYNYKIIGNQNIISTNKSLLFNNSGFSAIRNLIIKIKNNNFSSYQYCVRLKGLFNDLKLNNDGIHQTSFIMLGNFLLNTNILLFLKISLNFLLIMKINKKKVYFSINILDFNTIIILLLLKINIKKIIFTKKNIWKINNYGYLGFCLEIYCKFNNILLEVWNIVNINYLLINKKLFKIKNNIIDSGLGYYRLNLKKFSKKLKLIDLCNSVFLILSNININYTKNHNFLLNKILKILFLIVIKKKISILKIFFLFFKKNKKFYFIYNIKKFIFNIIRKEYSFFFDLKKTNINKINILEMKFIFETFGIPYWYLYKIIKNNYI